MGKTTLDKKFGARSVLYLNLEDCMSSNAEIEGKHCTRAFQSRRFSIVKQDYKTVFDVRNIPVISQAINIDKDLCIKLQIDQWYFSSPFLSGSLKGVKQSW